MSLEAIQKITETERLSVLRKAEAEQAAKKTVAEAERAGKAEQEVKKLMTQAEQDAAGEIQAVQKQTEQDCQKLKAEAETQLEQAADWIVRRVVSG